MKPLPLEITYFLEISQHLRYSTTNGQYDNNRLSRSSSFGLLLNALNVHDFEIIRVLGQVLPIYYIY
jgi:hypothetical protein